MICRCNRRMWEEDGGWLCLCGRSVVEPSAEAVADQQRLMQGQRRLKGATTPTRIALMRYPDAGQEELARSTSILQDSRGFGPKE